MVGVASTAGNWKIALLLMYTVIFINVILGLVAASVESVQQGSGMPLVRFVGDTVAGADEKIYESVMFLQDEELIASNPEVYTREYQDFHRNLIVHSLFLIAILVLAFYKLYRATIWASAQPGDFWAFIGAFALAFVTIGVLEFAWVLIDKGNFIIPFHGLWELVWNAGNIWGVALSSDPISVTETAQNITEVVNGTGVGA